MVTPDSSKLITLVIGTVFLGTVYMCTPVYGLQPQDYILGQ